MILPGNASLIISATRHLLKLGHRLDNLAAERTAVQAELVLQLPPVATPDTAACVALVRAELERTRDLTPDPFGPDRAFLAAEVALPQPTGAFGARFKKYFPDTGLLANPDAAYLAKLQTAFPGCDWRDPGARIAAFALTAGADQRSVSYNARLALSIADTLLEFGAENTARFIREEKLRGLAETVLQRLAEPEWGSFENWNPLLQTALKAVLNAALDGAEKIPAGSNNPWLAGLLDALLHARLAAPQPDDYLLGLLQGDGFRVLLSQGLLSASDHLDDHQADPFRLIAAEVLSTAAPLVQDQTNPSFRNFFNAHWGDLLRAGLTAADHHGDLILTGQDPLLRKVLQTLVQQLAQLPDAQLLTSATVSQLAQTTIGLVVDNLANRPGLEKQPWLREYLKAVTASARQLTLNKLFTHEAAETFLLDAIGVLARHPDLLIKQPGLPQTLVGAVLSAVAPLPRPAARVIGEAALRAALQAIARDPALADRPLGPTITAVATTLAGLVGQGQLTAQDAAALVATALEATARNPQLFAGLPSDLASAIITTIHQALANPTAQPWARPFFVSLAQTTLLAVARAGAALVPTPSLAELEKLLGKVIASGLTRATSQLGLNVDLAGIPLVLTGLIDRALRQRLPNLDPQSPLFIAAFDELAATLPSS